MNRAVGHAASVTPYEVRTHNTHSTSENRMHSDDVAAAYGFKGALVPGVTVFSHMTQPLVANHGAAWLSRGIAEVRFFKPAYDCDLLRIAGERAADDRYSLKCSNVDGVELACMTSQLRETPPAVDPRASVAPAPPRGKQLVAWDLMVIGEPFPALAWRPTRGENLQWCEDSRDQLKVYRDGATPLLHPGLILRQANLVLRNRFTMPAWIHAASRIQFNSAAHAGDELEVRAIPEEKWRHKGHEFVRLYVCIRRGEQVLAEILHTAIFQPRMKEVAAG
jgi:acyl dehydratase